jgi:hypothetical protein
VAKRAALFNQTVLGHIGRSLITTVAESIGRVSSGTLKNLSVRGFILAVQICSVVCAANAYDVSQQVTGWAIATGGGFYLTRGESEKKGKCGNREGYSTHGRNSPEVLGVLMHASGVYHSLEPSAWVQVPTVYRNERQMTI